MKELPKVYDPKEVEAKIYDMWMKNGYFHAERDASRKPFSIVMPPPNVTGQLHMGHALDCTLPDILIRYKRMQGYNAMWLPGTDHAGIATQNVVERELLAKGIKKEEIGRDEFLKHVWKWKEQSGGSQRIQPGELSAGFPAPRRLSR